MNSGPTALRVGTTRHSRKAVVDAIAASGPATRSELVERTGLSRATVAAVVGEMLAAGALTERTPEVGSARGRRPALLSLSAPRGLLGAIDLGHRHIGVAISRNSTELLDSVWLDDGVDVDADPEAALEVAVDALRNLRAAISADEALVSIAVSVPQPVNASSRSIIPTPFLKSWHVLDIGRRLTETFNVPMRIENDANAAALAESDNDNGPDNVIFVKVSTGIGMGIVLAGKPVRGSRGHAGEIGHMVIDSGGQLCSCGNRGCLETFASVPAVIRALEPVHGRLQPQDLARLLSSGNTAAERAMQDAGNSIGRALAPVLAGLQIDRVVIDGPRQVPMDALIRGTLHQVRAQVHPEIIRDLRIVPGRHGHISSLMGALRLAAEEAHRTEI